MPGFGASVPKALRPVLIYQIRFTEPSQLFGADKQKSNKAIRSREKNWRLVISASFRLSNWLPELWVPRNHSSVPAVLAYQLSFSHFAVIPNYIGSALSGLWHADSDGAATRCRLFNDTGIFFCLRGLETKTRSCRH